MNLFFSDTPRRRPPPDKGAFAIRAQINSHPKKRKLFHHSQDVKRLVRRIAAELEWSPLNIWLLEMAAARHDLGKERYPELFYNYVGKFDDAQRQLAAEHAYAGAVLIQAEPEKYGVPREYARPVALMVGCHHVWFEHTEQKYRQMIAQGEFSYRGYMPMYGGRIIKVADYYTARIEGREESEFLTPAMTLDIMRKTVGTQFCPLTFDALLRALRPSSTKES